MTDTSIHFDEVCFASRHEVGIQAADLWARELMKRFDTALFDVSAQPRPSFQTLYETRRFGGDLFCKGYFEGMRAQMEELQRQAGMSRISYGEWLMNKRRIDNQSNRLEYLMKVDAEKRNKQFNSEAV